MRDSEPVVVVGAGPVGLVTALLLARHGVPSVVLEAAARRDPSGSRAICFQRDVLDVLDRVGCAEPMIARGVTWTTGRTYYRGDELFAVTFPDAGRSAVPPWINISQAEVEAWLRDRAAAEPLVEVRYGQRVTGLRQDGDGVEARSEGTAGVTVRGTHLVGADGGHSAVRDLLGIGFPGRTFTDRFLICDIRADLPFPSERRFFFDPEWNPGRQVLVHQCPDGTWRIDWQVPADHDLDAERGSGALDARIRRITGDVPYEVVWATVYRFHERCAAAFASGRAFLAGDAAHVYAPFGARGLNSGVQDAENLAWKLAFVRHGWAPPALLRSYDAERRAAAGENLRVTTRTMEFLVPQTARQRARRLEALEAARTHPDPRTIIDSGRLAEPFWYLDSPLTTPAGPVEDFPRGPGLVRPPLPGVLCPDGPCVVDGEPTRLRRLFGTRFVVLTQGVHGGGLPTGVPHQVLALDSIDADGVLRTALHAGPDTVHIVRPDGHLAAVLPAYDPAAAVAALHRACGRS
ncbi:FAD-dependent monooxygenase [Actinomadura citrea]|uniref:2-polyprenyl-6-methoxyphenol hydroxylase-like FAD-dependent oxidoreductase n=1 Tax=Actinomadura citrea TaxID=46158 RepID=A0A7Y9KDE8_9ACTN|nr:FAD-dependent monooxygenase [Actinomadura citrea]NYE15007.1 2-polyprenyl-6-methoxyphenol hydroxylase-like FAD-dependent oxidoreductase [Actinomadura citrea]GGT84713.1 FAD-dependent oxidoreductase [Actinomadura citrea]